MSSVDYVEEARGWAVLLEEREAKRAGQNVEDARSTVARQCRVPESIFVSLRKRRLKDIGVSKYFKLRAAVVRELQSEMRRHQHELDLLHQSGADHRSPEVQAAKAGVAACRAALGISD